MFQRALRRLILIDVAMASAAVVLLLVVAFFLIRTNLDRSAYRNLEDVAEAISGSDLHEIFEKAEEHRSDFKTETITTSGSTSYWIIGLNKEIYLASITGSDIRPAHQADATRATNGSVQKSIIKFDSDDWADDHDEESEHEGDDDDSGFFSSSGNIRVVTIPVLRSNPPYLVQVASPDTVGPELRPIIISLLITGAIGVVIAAIAGAVVARKTMHPVQKAFELQRDFVSGASHELRTPVAVIQANADAIQRLVPNLEHEDSTILQDLQIESQFLGELIGRLSELARLQGDSRSQLDVVDVGKFNDELARSMGVLVNNAGMKISAVAPSKPIYAVADRVMLRQVALSLIDNSIKYAGNGASIELTVTAENDQCQLMICDDGIGISEEHLPHVTERFYRADKARSRKIGGSGLGLSIADEAVNRMGGTLEISSDKGSGTVITIALPISSSALSQP